MQGEHWHSLCMHSGTKHCDTDRARVYGAHQNTLLYMIQVGLSAWCLYRYRLTGIFKYGIYASMVIDGGCSLMVIANEYLVCYPLSVGAVFIDNSFSI